MRGPLDAGVHGLVLEAYGTGNLPHLGGSLIPALEEARDWRVPVLVVSQCLRGFVAMESYAGGAAAHAAGAISGGDMTVEAAIAKLMIGLARARAIEARCARGSRATWSASGRRSRSAAISPRSWGRASTPTP